MFQSILQDFLETNFMQMMLTSFLVNLGFLSSQYSYVGPTRRYKWFYRQFRRWSTTTCSIFAVHMIRMNSMELLLCFCSQYCFGCIKCPFFYRMLRLFTLVVMVLKTILNFLFSLPVIQNWWKTFFKLNFNFQLPFSMACCDVHIMRYGISLAKPYLLENARFWGIPFVIDWK